MSIFKLPDLGEGLAEAEINKWHVKIGDSVEVDEPLVAIETAKAIVEVPSPQRGVIKLLYGKEGDTIKTNAPLVEFESNSNNDDATVAGKIESGTAILEEATMIGNNYSEKEIGIKATPAVRAMAKKLDIDLSQINPTGPGNTITVKDIENHNICNIKNGLQLGSIRKVMHNTMIESQKNVVPATICDDADISAWDENQDITIRLIRALVAGCKKEPILNSWFNAQNLTLSILNNIDLGLAVDSLDGLFVPVLKNIQDSDFGTNLRDQLNILKNKIKNRTIELQD